MLVLGENANPDLHPDVKEVSLTHDARKQGTYVIGTTGTGKTTLLLNMVLQDIEQGEGLCVLDPHGDFTRDILLRIPDHRRDDVILFDPNDFKRPFGLNLLDCNRKDPRERDRVVSTIIDTLYKMFSDSWGPRMEDLLRHAILSLLLHPEQTTLVNLYLLLTNREQRARLTAAAKEKDPILRAYWVDEFPEDTWSEKRQRWYKPDQQVQLVSSSLNKIGRFLTNPITRNIVGQPESTVNLRQVMDDGKILLVNLSKGDLGADNTALLGSIMVNQLLIAALSRRDTPEAKRRPFHLYVDEFQTFATRTFPELQSEARKYGIDTIVANQYREQLDDDNKGSTLNVANLIVLRVSGRDAYELAGQFDNKPDEPEPRIEPYYMPLDQEGRVIVKGTLPSGEQMFEMVEGQPRAYSDIHMEMANLLGQVPNYQAICRVLDPTNARTLQQYRLDLQRKPDGENPEMMQYIKEKSRRMAKYTLEEISEYIKKQSGFDSDDDYVIPAFDNK